MCQRNRLPDPFQPFETYLKHLVGRRFHAESALKLRVPVDFQKADVQAYDGRVGLGTEYDLHTAVVVDVVFGHGPVGFVQIRVQEHLVALRLDRQKWYLAVRDAHVRFLYEPITIINNIIYTQRTTTICLPYRFARRVFPAFHRTN